MKRFRIHSFIGSLFFFLSSALGQSYFPETGPLAIHQRSLDTRGRLNVLAISLEAGYEDLGTLAYFRMARGAKVLSAYVTNGESGESDLSAENPLQLAATRREEAAHALSLLDGDVFFLNMPDIAAAPDTASIRSQWPTDTLQLRLMKLIADFRPDVVILSRDWRAAGSTSCRWDVLKDDLIHAIKTLASSASAKSVPDFGSTSRWSLEKLWMDEGLTKGTALPLERIHPLIKKSYQALGEDAGQAYESMRAQRRLRERELRNQQNEKRRIWYSLAYPLRHGSFKTLDQGSPGPVTPRLRGIEHSIESLTSLTMKGRPPAEARHSSLLKQLASVMDSLDVLIARSYELSAKERRIALQWKLGLENLRTSLLGVSVKYRLSDSILTQLQLTFLHIDTVVGMPPGGTTELFFANMDGWVINESMNKRMPLELKKEYRLLSPKEIQYNIPFQQYGLDDPIVGKPLLLFIVHRAPRHEESFVYRTARTVLYAPRFTAEILTPIVRAIPGERVIVRLANHSRDGVRDFIYVNDSLVTSNRSEFRLNIKDAFHLDTLRLTWQRPLEDGTYVIPIKIEDQEVARFAARKFDAVVDTTRRVGLVTGLENSATEETLRRLSVKYEKLPLNGRLSDRLTSFQVILVDRRALTLDDSISTSKDALTQFARQGGHLLILAQDAAAWNDSPLIDGLKLTASTELDERSAVEVDSTHAFLSKPNRIMPSDWTNWLYLRGHNRVSGPALSSASMPVKAAREDSPLILTWTIGGGHVTYIDLALRQQFLNIHPGAFRLLANLISY